MTLRFHAVGSVVRHVYGQERKSQNYFVDFNQIVFNDKIGKYT